MEIEPNTRGPYLAKHGVSRMSLKLIKPFRVGLGTGWVSKREYNLKTPSAVKTTAKVVGLI